MPSSFDGLETENNVLIGLKFHHRKVIHVAITCDSKLMARPLKDAKILLTNTIYCLHVDLMMILLRSGITGLGLDQFLSSWSCFRAL